MKSNHTVRDYETGDELAGAPSDELIRRSMAAGEEGAVAARRDAAGVWQYVDEAETDGECTTVYVVDEEPDEDDSPTALVQCQCGQITGERCAWHGPRSETVVVEYMPESLRASHEAAGNRGSYPANGAIRCRCERECAARIVEEEDGWASIVD